MDRNAFSERYHIDLKYSGPGQVTFRLTDRVTRQNCEVIESSIPDEHAAQQLATGLYTEVLDAPPYPTKLSGVETYRDGGSLGILYKVADNQQFEFFLPIAYHDDDWQAKFYIAPILFFDSVNSKRVAYNFSWGEAEDFLLSLMHDSEVAESDILPIVQRCGRI